ncbi:unnamed protein product, partial [marine sediment metagenome]
MRRQPILAERAMHTWNTVWRTLVCGALLLALPGGGCVISIDPLDGGG